MSAWNWLKPSIDRGVKKGVDDFVSGPKFKSILDNVIREELRKPEYRWFWFVKAMQAKLMEVDKTLSGKRAWQIAVTAYREFLEGEKIEFGDPRYGWTRDDARELIQEMEIDHWESVA